ncbi:4-phytase / acid phosphatase [Bryocella elongata]|uniref:4-phytase / acid phosphatase n=1 Tax=Bryocella elongata TaxID=863522 RepID=A0A1H6CGG1_9BACT|nr:histidine-type phosphatase [Bryocella elongata]SEG72100.1 4-phytase / acid phosphatase [Bryocella elongata]
MRHLFHFFCAALLFPFGSMAAQSPAPAADASHADQEQLVYTVMVERHGVRSPTGKSSQYDRFAASPWPTWDVQPGYLTAHGYELMKLFGAYDREHLASQGLLQPHGCDDSAHVTVHADSDQRTRETAKALVEGMFPGCNLQVKALEEGTNDPLFHLPGAAITPEQAALGAAAVLGRIGNDPGAVATAYHAELAALDRVLSGCGASNAEGKRTSIFEVPAAVSAGNGDHIADVRGPLNTASTLSEILLLEYTEGRPSKDVGWGCVDGAKLRELIGLHTAASDIALKTEAVAVPQSAALLRSVALSLRQAADGRGVRGAEGRPSDKLLLLVGHDTNLTNIAGALHLNWLLDGRRDDTPPGSALVFELRRKKGSSQLSVRTYFTAQTLEQMREASALSETKPPARVPVFVPGCSRTDGSCDANAMSQLLLHVAESR